MSSQTNHKTILGKMPNHEFPSFCQSQFFLMMRLLQRALFCSVSLVLFGCSSDEYSSNPAASDTGRDCLRDGNATTGIQFPSPPNGIPAISGSPRLPDPRREGPRGDMDGDGIPNFKDPNPVVAEQKPSTGTKSLRSDRSEGSDGDMDGDGIPNSKDPTPIGEQTP